MIAKKYRFTRREFDSIRKKMKKFKAGDFIFLYAPGKVNSKLAVVISKKVEKSAVKRNGFRREVYDRLGSQIIGLADPIFCICLYKGQAIPKNITGIEVASAKFLQFIAQKTKA